MNPIRQRQQGPASPISTASRRPYLNATLIAAGALVALMVSIVIGASHSHAGIAPGHRASAAPTSSTWDSTVPGGSDLFVDPETGVVVSAEKR